jgi:hypothetical protein
VADEITPRIRGLCSGSGSAAPLVLYFFDSVGCAVAVARPIKYRFRVQAAVPAAHPGRGDGTVNQLPSSSSGHAPTGSILLLAALVDDAVNERLRLSDRAPVRFCVAATAAGEISRGTMTNWNKSMGASDMNVATSV